MPPKTHKSDCPIKAYLSVHPSNRHNLVEPTTCTCGAEQAKVGQSTPEMDEAGLAFLSRFSEGALVAGMGPKQVAALFDHMTAARAAPPPAKEAHTPDEESKRLAKKLEDYDKLASTNLCKPRPCFGEAAAHIRKQAAERDRLKAEVNHWLAQNRGIRMGFIELANASAATIVLNVDLTKSNKALVRDANMLLSIIDWLEEATGEGPQNEDAAVVKQIRAALKGETP